MNTSVRMLNQRFIDLWWGCETSLPDLGRAYTAGEQAQNEEQLSAVLKEVEDLLLEPRREREGIETVQMHLGAALRALAAQALEVTETQLEYLPAQAFSEAAQDFVRKARAFDSQLSGEDIYQAGRNAWTANGLQWLLGLPVGTTPSLLAYSLLYPYTDNYLDDPAISASAKLAFNERFRLRLAGEPVAPTNPREIVIFELVAMIEGQYSRPEHPRVFESLLAIHRAQAKSLGLLHHSADLPERDVLALSFEKGGTSVLADGDLVSPFHNDAQRAYAYGHGVFAQLLDDMEDVGQDSRAGRLTLYSQAAGHSTLDALANRTFHFGRKILMGLDCFHVAESLYNLIDRGAVLVLIDAISRTDGYYSQSYLRALEAHSPFRFSFLKEQRASFFKRHGSLGELMETILSLQGEVLGYPYRPR